MELADLAGGIRYSPLTVTGTLEPYGGEVLVVPMPNSP